MKKSINKSLFKLIWNLRNSLIAGENDSMICGIVAEYNPFHLGHEYQLKTLRKKHDADLLVIVMSGHFLQRGIPAIIDKWKRAEMAVRCGADLVVELPVQFSNASSDIFAMGAMKILSDLDVDTISFGCEQKDLDKIHLLADVVQGEEYLNYRNTEMSKGLSAAAASSVALSKITKNETYLGSNATLGLAYVLAMRKLGLNYNPIVIPRLGPDYMDANLDGTLSSAYAIRMALSQKTIDWAKIESAMPREAFEILMEYPKYSFGNDFSQQILSKIYSLRAEGLLKIRGVSEGIENRIIKFARKNKNFDDLVTEISTKRYTDSTVRRILINILIGIERVDYLEDVESLNYRRVLAMNEKGKAHLKNLKKKPEAKTIVNFAREVKRFNLSSKSLEYDVSATGLYSLVSESVSADSDYTVRPFILEKV